MIKYFVQKPDNGEMGDVTVFLKNETITLQNSYYILWWLLKKGVLMGVTQTQCDVWCYCSNEWSAALTLLCEPCVMVEALNWAGLTALHATLSSSRKPKKKTSDTMT